MLYFKIQITIYTFILEVHRETSTSIPKEFPVPVCITSDPIYFFFLLD